MRLIAYKEASDLQVVKKADMALFKTYWPMISAIREAVKGGNEELFMTACDNNTRVSLTRHGENDNYLAVEEGDRSLTLTFDDDEVKKVSKLVADFLTSEDGVVLEF